MSSGILLGPNFQAMSMTAWTTRGKRQLCSLLASIRCLVDKTWRSPWDPSLLVATSVLVTALATVGVQRTPDRLGGGVAKHANLGDRVGPNLLLWRTEVKVLDEARDHYPN